MTAFFSARRRGAPVATVAPGPSPAMVLAGGEVLRTGGRVHKNKTGFDLIGLFVGSEGMLGVVTEITVRLLPLPPARATLSAAFATMKEAAAAVQAIFHAGFLPAALEIQVEDVEEVPEQGLEVLAIRLVGGNAGLEGGPGLGDETLAVDPETLFGAAQQRQLLRDL